MDKQKYIDKVKKLLALSKSTNPHEAALAMERALKLMAEHAINESDVKLSDINEFMAKRTPTDAQKQPQYVGMLFNAICIAFGVDGYFDYNQETHHRTVTFYGMRERPQLAAYAFDVLVRLITKARKEFLNKKNKRIKKSTMITRADKFCAGWVNGVYSGLSKFIIPDDEKNTLIQYEKDKLNLKRSELRKAKNCNGADNAMLQGYFEGKNTKLNHGVTGSQSEPLRLGNHYD